MTLSPTNHYRQVEERPPSSKNALWLKNTLRITLFNFQSRGPYISLKPSSKLATSFLLRSEAAEGHFQMLSSNLQRESSLTFRLSLAKKFCMCPWAFVCLLQLTTTPDQWGYGLAFFKDSFLVISEFVESGFIASVRSQTCLLNSVQNPSQQLGNLLQSSLPLYSAPSET